MKRVLEAIILGLEARSSNYTSNDASNDGRRLFHGRGQCYQGLGYINVDWFAPVLLITLYQEVEPQGWQQLLAGLGSLAGEIDCGIVQRRYLRGSPIETLFGELPEQPLAIEQELKFALSFAGKQNIGFFLDMSPGRQWLRERAEGKRVLNLFSYTCSFSVAAMASNAKYVVNSDMSRAALNVGRQNHCLNHQHDRLKRDVEFLPYDLFRSWK
ncbi:MAG: class I SAM-dependent methyltransferase, partial [Pseudomonadales bacterium]